MKQSDIATIILVASISVITAYFVASSVIVQPTGESATVKTMAPISSEVENPDPKIFNANAINPTVQIEIGNDSGS